jgi:hypothetical protein
VALLIWGFFDNSNVRGWEGRFYGKTEPVAPLIWGFQCLSACGAGRWYFGFFSPGLPFNRFASQHEVIGRQPYGRQGSDCEDQQQQRFFAHIHHLFSLLVTFAPFSAVLQGLFGPLLSLSKRALIVTGRCTMVDNVVPTLAPKRQAPDVITSLPSQPRITPLNTEKNAIFDSIAQEGIESQKDSQNSSLKTFLTGLLWFGYAIAIVVALVLVWEAASGLLKSLPR